MRRLLVLLVAASGSLAFVPTASNAQAFEPGPVTSVPGSSVSGMRIDGAPSLPSRGQIDGAYVFGDTVEERVYGRPYDDSYLRPRIPSGAATQDIEERAAKGRSELNDTSASAYARQGPNAIGSSEITRPHGSPSHRAIIRGSSGKTTRTR